MSFGHLSIHFSGGKYARTNFLVASYMMMYDNTILPDNQDSCLSFWYHMQGRYPGKLEVKIPVHVLFGTN